MAVYKPQGQKSHGAALAILCFLLSFSCGSAQSYNDSKLLCMTQMVSSIESSCVSPDTQGYYVVLEELLHSYLSKCFNVNFALNRALHVMLPNISFHASNFLSTYAETWRGISANSSVRVVPTFIPDDQINNEVIFMLQHNQAISNDGWIMSPKGFGTVVGMMGAGGLLDLTDRVTTDEVLDWPDVLPYVRDIHSSYSGRVYGLPIEANMNLFYYRRDLFEAFNISIPETWDDVLNIALTWNSSDINIRNGTDFGICLEARKSCNSPGWDLISIAAPYLQYTGMSQGVYFDPLKFNDPSSQPALVNNPAFMRALDIYGQLRSMGPSSPTPFDICTAPFPMDLFSKGKCLMTMSHNGFKRIMKAKPPAIKGYQVGIIRTPGADVVFSRTQNKMMNCSASLCPFSEPSQYGPRLMMRRNLLQGSDGLVGTNSSWSQGNSPSLQPDPGNDMKLPVRYINRAPFAPQGGWLSCVNSLSTTEYQNLSYQFLSSLSSPNISWIYLLDSGTSSSPYRQQHFSNISRWIDAGYDANATKAYLAQGYASLSSPNIVPDLRLAGLTDLANSIWTIYSDAAGNATARTPKEKIVSNMIASISSLIKAASKGSNFKVMSATYWATIGYIPQNQTTEPGLLKSDDSKGSPPWLAAAIVLPVVAALIFIIGGVIYEVRNSRNHRDFWGKVKPPGIGPETSILVAEVEDSTIIWNAVGADIMEKTLQDLRSCLFRIVRKYSGCCSTSYDGDTLVFAFHNLKDTLLFAMEAQTALLNVAWSPAIMEVPCCRPVYIQLKLNDMCHMNLEEIFDAEDESVHKHTTSHFLPVPRFRALTGGSKENPIIPALSNVPSNETCSFADACRRAWVPTKKSDPNKVIVFRGLSLRMGVQSGFYDASNITVDPKENVAHYKGPTVESAQRIAMAATGGMVLMSEETYKKLPLERLWDRQQVLHFGEYRLCDGHAPKSLYHALSRGLEGRLGLLKPTMDVEQLDTGVFGAPVGRITIAFMNVVGAQTLLSWDADVAHHALKTFHLVVGEQLKKYKGYLVEAVDGLFLAAFQTPANAILWALDCNEEMIGQDWSEDLLSHELCEELVICAPTKDGQVINTVVFRGLRLKTGVDTGQVLGEVHAMTGRLTYRGKVMNRAARVASTASTGQVLCSAEALVLAKDKLEQSGSVVTSCLGEFRLKGVSDKIEVFHCRKTCILSKARRASVVMAMADPWKWDRPPKPSSKADISLDNDEDAMNMSHFLAIDVPLQLNLGQDDDLEDDLEDNDGDDDDDDDDDIVML